MHQQNLVENLSKTKHIKQSLTTGNSPANPNLASFKQPVNFGAKQPIFNTAVHSNGGSYTQKNSISRETITRAVKEGNGLPDVERYQSQGKQAQPLGKSDSILTLHTGGKSQKNSKRIQKRSNKTPLSYTGPSLLANQPNQPNIAIIQSMANQSSNSNNKSLKQIGSGSTAALHQGSIVVTIQKGQPVFYDTNQARLVKRIVKKSAIASNKLNTMNSPKQQSSPIKFSSSKMSPLHQQQSAPTFNNNVGVKRSQILRNVQQSPSSVSREIVPQDRDLFQDHLDQLFEVSVQKKPLRQNEQTPAFNQEPLFPDQAFKTKKIGDAVFKAMNTQKSQLRVGGEKSRTSKKSFLQQSNSRSNKSQKTKDQLQSSQSQNKLGIKSAKVSRQVTTDAVNAEILSRNDREDSGQIDLRIATKMRQTSGNKAILTKVGNSNEPISPEDLQGQNGNSSSIKKLQFNRQLPSKSQCKNRIELPDNLSNLKKSYSIALLKASNSHTSGVPIMASSINEYSCLSSREEQKTPFDMMYYNQVSQKEYAKNGGLGKRSESSNSGGSSLNDISINDVKQQAVKNNSHYGALKHLAMNNVKPGSLFTRNNSQSQSQKKLTSFDENVRVNVIRETGHVHQKFSKQSPDVQNIFAIRKNYGSVCIQPQNPKNKPLFFSVVDQGGKNQNLSITGADSRASFVEQTPRRYEIFSNTGKIALAQHRHALSSASSPKFTPQNISLPMKSPFLSKESQKQFSMKDKAPKPQRKSIQQQNLNNEVKHMMSQTSVKQTKMSWADNNQIEPTQKLKKKTKISGSVRSPSGGNPGSNAMKATLFAHQNSNPDLATDFQNPLASQSQKEEDNKTKRHKFSKSREFYGSQLINQMNLNSSISSKTSQLKQDGIVFNSKRKSQGTTQTRLINSGLAKRRSSATSIGETVPPETVTGIHNQTQPLHQKKPSGKQILQKNPQKIVEMRGSDSEELQDQGEEKFVERIVDLLEKRNLISTKNNHSNKPQVNKILSSLLKAHLKQVDSNNGQNQHLSQTERKMSQPIRIEADQEEASLKVQKKVSTKIATEKSDSSTVLLGTASKQKQEPAQLIFSIEPSLPHSKQPSASQSILNSVSTKNPQQAKKQCKRNGGFTKQTPGFKYPMTPSEKEQVYSISESVVEDKGEMTSPGELYYVNTKNVQNQNYNAGGQVINHQQNNSSKSSESDSVIYPFIQKSQQVSKPSSESPQPQQSLKYNNQQTSRGSGSLSDHKNYRDPTQVNKKAYYAGGGGSSKLSQLGEEKRIEGKSTYYANHHNSQERQSNEQQHLHKESTRFSSNERTPIYESNQYDNKEYAKSSRESSQKQQQQQPSAAQEYNESATKSSRRSVSQGRSAALRVSNSQGKLQQAQATSPKNKKARVSSPTDSINKNGGQKDTGGSGSENDDASVKDEGGKEDDESLILNIRRHFASQKKRNTNFPTSLRCYKVQSIVGKGAFGKVALAVNRLTKKSVAIKIIDKTTLQPGQMEKVRSEVALMSAIRHKHIIRLLEVFEGNQHMYMVFEYASGGDLLQLVKKKRCLTERESRTIFRQVVYGIAHCHCRSVLHRDIKLDNILLDEKGNVKVCDFGISRPLEDLAEPIMEQCGTPAYIAPEILYEDGYKGFKSDIWGLGVLLYAMVTGTVPFRAQNMRELKYVISSGQFSFPNQNPRDQTRYSENLKDLIRSCLLVNIQKRISIPEILCHPWLSSTQDRQSMQQGLNYQQLLSINALQPFGSGMNHIHLNEEDRNTKIHQIRVENLFIGHGSDADSGDSSLHARIEALSLTQSQLNEITIDHATVYINEKAVSKLETFGFPKKLVRQQIQASVLNHATACYNLLVL